MRRLAIIFAVLLLAPSSICIGEGPVGSIGGCQNIGGSAYPAPTAAQCGIGEIQGPSPATENAAGGCGPRTIHEKSQVLYDFSSMPKTNLVLRPDGSAELQKADSQYNMPDFAVCATVEDEGSPSAAADSENGFIAAWSGTNGCYARRYDSQGGEIGGVINVSSGVQPEVAADPRGGFIVVWLEDAGGGCYNISAQRFAVDGNRNGSELAICSTAVLYINAAVGINSRGEAFITWIDFMNFALPSLYVQRLDPDGNKNGSLVKAAEAKNIRGWPCVAADPFDDFVVIYNKYTSYPMYDDIYAQRLRADGSKNGSALTLVYAPEMQYDAVLAVDSMNHLVLGYTHHYVSGMTTNERKVRLQLFNPDGSKLGGEIAVASGDFYGEPAIALDSRDYITVAWKSNGPGAGMDICARQYDALGGSVGNVLQVCSAANDQIAPALSAASAGRMLIAWEDGRGGTDCDIYAGVLYRPYLSPGSLTTFALAPADPYTWVNITANLTLGNASANGISYKFSEDSGSSWTPVPVNGSLAGAGSAPSLRFRATLSAGDNTTTPVLRSIIINYITDRAPLVTACSDDSVWRNARVNATAGGTDDDGDPLTYSWKQTGGPPLNLTNLSSPSFTFSPNRSGTYRFQVKAYDGYLSSAPALFNATVSNRAPGVVTGPDIFRMKGESATLLATTQDPDSDLLSYEWTQVSGCYTYLDRSDLPGPSFLCVRAGTFGFSVKVSDGEAESAPAFVNLTVFGHAPLAALNVSASQVLVNESVQFDASGSWDPDGYVTAYNFDFGDSAGSGWVPGARADHAYSAPGKYSAAVKVRDEDGNVTDSGKSSIIVLTPPPPPVPRIVITSPPEIQEVASGNVTVAFRVEDFTVASGAGHVNCALDNREVCERFDTIPFTVNISEGNHTLRLSLEKASHVPLGNPEAAAEVHFRGLPPPPPALPDLEITSSDIQLEPQRPRAEETVTFSASVHNTGLVGAPGFIARFYISGTPIGERSLSALGKGETLNVNVSWKVPKSGTYLLKVVVDAGATVQESSESNNEAYANFSVSGVPAQPAPVEPLVYIAATVAVVLFLTALLLQRRRRGVARDSERPAPRKKRAAPRKRRGASQSRRPPRA